MQRQSNNNNNNNTTYTEVITPENNGVNTQIQQNQLPDHILNDLEALSINQPRSSENRTIMERTADSTTPSQVSPAPADNLQAIREHREQVDKMNHDTQFHQRSTTTISQPETVLQNNNGSDDALDSAIESTANMSTEFRQSANILGQVQQTRQEIINDLHET